jgi:hypothetical protein
MGYIAQPDLVQNMTPEQRIMVSQFYSKFDIGSGVAHKKIINVEPLFYLGAIAASEFITYAATKMYLCLASFFSSDNDAVSVPSGSIIINDSGNNAIQRFVKSAIVWDTTGAAEKYLLESITVNNYFCSCYTASNYISMKFIGYRITLT